MSRNRTGIPNGQAAVLKDKGATSSGEDSLTLIFTKLSLGVFLTIGVVLMIATYLYSAGY